MGDLLIGAKINLLSEKDLAPVAFALRGMAKFPTGSESEGTSTGKLDGSFDAIVSKDLGAAELAGYGGFVFRGDPRGVDLPNSFRYGVGIGVPVGRAFTLIGEINGEALTSDEIRIQQALVGTDGSMSGMLSRVKSPADAMVGLQWNAQSGLYIGAGLNISMVHGNREDAGRSSKTGDRTGFLVRIGYHPGVNVYAPPPPPPPDAPANRPPLCGSPACPAAGGSATSHRRCRPRPRPRRRAAGGSVRRVTAVSVCDPRSLRYRLLVAPQWRRTS